MSENVLAWGYAVLLAEPVNYDDVIDNFENSGLQLNYEGTIVFLDKSSKDDVFGGMYLLRMDKDAIHEFVEHVESTGVKIDDTQVRAFTSPWYNGSDSYMSDFKAADWAKF